MNKRTERTLIIGAAWALIAILVAISLALPYYAHSSHHSAAQSQTGRSKLTVDAIVGSTEPPTDKVRQAAAVNKEVAPNYEQHKLALRQAVAAVRSILDQNKAPPLKDFVVAAADVRALEKKYVNKRSSGGDAAALRTIAESYVEAGLRTESTFNSLTANASSWAPFNAYWQASKKLEADLNWFELNGDNHKDELKNLIAPVADWESTFMVYLDTDLVLAIFEAEVKAQYGIPEDQPLPAEIRHQAVLRKAVSHLETLTE